MPSAASVRLHAFGKHLPPCALVLLRPALLAHAANRIKKTFLTISQSFWVLAATCLFDYFFNS
jgi:hypothetical protein